MGSVEVELWADGSGRTSGPIGFAWVLIHRASGVIREGHAGEVEGTNNRAELLAVIHGLRALTRPCVVEITTDSEYVGKAYPSGWVDAWKRKNWRKVKNVDLWLELDREVARHTVTWKWVKGHTGHRFNESCDLRAGECRRAIIAAMAENSPLTGLAFPVHGDAPTEQLKLAGNGSRAL